jgi:NADPH:quinone reductase-like Zn-dependent oxidoreductase
MMKAIVYTQYGPPEVLHVRDVEKPTPNDDQVLVHVHAVSLNPAEAHMMGGMLLARIMGGNGLLKPKGSSLNYVQRTKAAINCGEMRLRLMRCSDIAT